MFPNSLLSRLLNRIMNGTDPGRTPPSHADQATADHKADPAMEERAKQAIGQIDNYVRYMRYRARHWDRVARQQARMFEQTGEPWHRFSQLAWEKGDDTGRRLRAYQRLLQDMKWAGEYDGDTELKRVLPDGHTEPLWTRPPAR